MLKILRFNVLVSRNFYVRKEQDVFSNIIKRHSGYLSSKPIPKEEDLPKYEVSKDEKEWEFVTRLLYDKTIPDTKMKLEYPSGWIPQLCPKNAPYVLQRTKNNMLPIYLALTKGTRKSTMLKKIHGDIWKMARDIKNYLENIHGREIPVKIHELFGKIEVHGDHVSNLKIWALKKKF